MKQARIPTAQEFRRLLALISTERHKHRNRMAVMLSYYGGLRACEIAALDTADLIASNGVVLDQAALSASKTKGKTGRTIHIGRRLRAEIELYLDTRMGLQSDAKAFLVSQKGRRFTANTMCQLLIGLYRRAGIAGSTSHSGRRSFITRLAHNGVSAKVIMTLAGHKHMTTTQRYIDVNDELLRGAVDRLD